MDEARKKQVVAAIAGLLDPWLRQKAQEAAGMVSENSVLRNKSVETVLGSLKGFIEAWAEKLPPAAATAIEKATDFGDFFAGALDSGTPAAETWLKEFITDAFRRLEKTGNPETELEKIKREFEIKQELSRFIKQEQAEKKRQPSETAARITDRLIGFNEKLAERIKILKARRTQKGGAL